MMQLRLGSRSNTRMIGNGTRKSRETGHGDMRLERESSARSTGFRKRSLRDLVCSCVLVKTT